MTSLIDDETATRFYNEIDNAPEEDRQQMADALLAWGEEKQSREREETDTHFSKLFTDDAYFQQINDNDPALSEALDPEATAKRASIHAYLEHQLNRPIDAANFEPERDAFAMQAFGQKNLNDGQLFDYIRGDYDWQKQRTEAINDLQMQSVGKAIADSQLGQTRPFVDGMTEVFNQWQQKYPELVDGKNDAAFLSQGYKLYYDTINDLDTVRPQASKALSTLTSFTQGNATDEDMQSLANDFVGAPPEDRQKIYKYVTLAAQAGQIDRAGIEQFAINMGQAFTRGFDFVPQGTLQIQEAGVNDVLQKVKSGQKVLVPQNGDITKATVAEQTPKAQVLGQAPTVGMFATPQDGYREATPEEADQFTSYATNAMESFKVVRELRNVAKTGVDPIRPVLEEKSFWGTAERGAYGLSGSIPLMGATAVNPYLGVLAYQATEYDRIMLENPEINPQFAQGLALVEGAANAAIDRVQLSSLTGRLPMFGRYLDRIASDGVRRTVKIGANVVEQNLQEGAQDLIAPVLETAVAALREDMPDKDFGKLLNEWGGQRAETFFATLPLALIGGGVATYRDIKNPSAELNATKLRMAGFGQDQVTFIQRAENPEEYDARIQMEWEKRTSENIKAGEQEVLNTIEKARTPGELDARIERVTAPDGSEDIVVTSPDGRELLRTKSEQAALEAVRQHNEAQLINERNAVSDMVDYFRAQDPTNEATIEAPRTVQQELDRLTEAGDSKGIANLNERIRFAGIPEGSDLTTYNILGEANVETTAEGVFRGVIKLRENSRPEDAFEEINHVFVRKALAEGRTDLDSLRGWLNQTSEATGETYATDTETDIIENIAKVGMDYAAGRIEETSLPASFVDYIKRMLQVFKETMARAIKLKDAFATGKIDSNFESFLAESVGLNQQTMVDTTRERASGDIITNGGQMLMDFSLGSRTSAVSTDTPSIRASNATITGPANYSIAAHHGTPHKVDKFSTAKIGTGEGAQAYGWGLYFAQAKAVGEGYRDRLSQGRPPSHEFKEKTGYSLGEYGVRELLKVTDLESAQAIRKSSQFLSQYSAQELLDLSPVARQVTTNPGGGNLYTVELDVEPEDLLDWDKPLSEQSPKVKALLANYRPSSIPEGRSLESMNGKFLYRMAVGDFADSSDSVAAAKSASEFFKSIGIPGIRYLDGGSRSVNATDERLLELAEKNNGNKEAAVDEFMRSVYDTPKAKEKMRSDLLRNFPERTSNYVVFDENLIKITEENGNRIPASQALAQPVSTDTNYSIRKVDETTGLPLNPNGTVTVYHGTTKESAAEIQRTGILKSAGEPDVYFTTAKEGTGYGDGTVVGVEIDPQKLILDDEFPDGRRDFRVNVGTSKRLAVNLTTGATNYSIGKAADLASKNPELAKEIQKKSDALLNAAEQGNDVFFTKFWPQMLKKTGMNFKPTKANLLKAAETGMPEILEWLKSNPQYLDYYHKDWELTHDILKAVFPKMTDDDLTGFRIFTGITSPNTKLMHNMADAVQLFNLWMDKGSIKSMRWEWSAKGNRKVGGGPFTFSGTTGAGKTFTAHVLEDLHGKLGSWESVKNYLWEGVSIKELNAFNKEAGYKGTVDAGKIRQVVQSATGQSELIPRMFIFGPKVGAYTLNTSGDDRYTTTDIWEGRFIRSHFPAMFNDADGLPTSVEENKIFQEFAQAFNEVFKRESGLDLPPSALQAVRWFYMLNHAKKAGYKYASTDDTISGYTERAVRLKLGINPRPAGAGGTGSDQANNGAPVQKGDTNYSIASQSEIDRVNKALGGMNRGPDERLKVYERAKQKFSKLMSWNSDELAAMADTGSDETQIRRNQLLQGFGELDAILQVLPPEVRGRVGGYTVLANIAPMDVFKDGVKFSEAKNMAGAIISAWKNEGQNIGQAGKQVSLPPGYTAKENLASKRADKALADFFRDRIKKIDTELEKVISREYRGAIERLLENALPKKSKAGVLTSTLGPEAAAFVKKAYAASLLDQDAAAERLQEIQGRLEEETDQKKVQELAEEWAVVNLFGAIDSSHSTKLASALDVLKSTIKAGRQKWKIQQEARREDIKKMVQTGLDTLGEFTSEQVNVKAKQERLSALRNIKDSYNRSLAPYQLLETIFGAEHPIAVHFSRKMRESTNDKNLRDIKARRLFEDAARVALGFQPGERGMKIRWAIDKAVLALMEDTKSVKAFSGRRVKAVRIPVEIAEKVVRGEINLKSAQNMALDEFEEGIVTMTGSQMPRLTDAHIDAIRQELASYNERLAEIDSDRLAEDPNATPARRPKYISIDLVVREGVLGERTMNAMEAMQFLATWNQPDGRAHMERNGFTEESVKQMQPLASSPFAKAIYNQILKYYADNYSDHNRVFVNLYGVDMPKNINHSPLRFETQEKEQGGMRLPGERTGSGGMMPGHIKSRTKHQAELAQASMAEVFWNHVENGNYWIAWAESVRDMRAVLLNPNLLKSVTAVYGEDAATQLRDMVTLFTEGGVQMKNRAYERIYNNIVGAVSTASLGFRLSSVVNQNDAGLRFTLKLSRKQQSRALVSLMQGNFVEKYRKVLESDTIQIRLEKGVSPLVRMMVENSNLPTNTQLPDLIKKFLPEKVAQSATGGVQNFMLAVHMLREQGFMPMQLTDTALTSFSATVVYESAYLEAKDAGMPDAAAEKAALDAMDDAVFKTAQPVDMAQRSLTENMALTWQRGLMQFMSDQRLKFSMWGSALRGLAKGEGDRTQHLQTLVALGIMGAASETLRAWYRDFFTDDDDEEIYKPSNWVRAFLVGPLTGFWWYGTILDTMLRGFLGERTFGMAGQLDSFLKDIERISRNPEPLYDWSDESRSLGAWKAAARVAGGLYAPAQVISLPLNIVEPVLGASENIQTEE